MMVMTAKVDFKKLIFGLIACIGVIVVLLLLLGNRKEDATVSANVSDNSSRIAYLKGFGWEVDPEPVRSGQIRIPTEQTEVYQRYCALQTAQGFDLTPYAGKAVMRYVYQVLNFPNATEPVYATLLICKNKIIAADLTDTAPNGMLYPLTGPALSE